jgi:tetratricopeptide (TPR) repeat protein
LKALSCRVRRLPSGIALAAVVVSVVLSAPAARARSGRLADADSPEAPAAAPRPLDAEVDRHAALGQRLLERGRTQDAIAEFRRAYELRADPRFLTDIADGYRRLGLVDQARFFYERYLAAAPDAPDRDDVEAALAALGRPAEPHPTLAHDVVIVPVTPAAESAPLWRRWWVWTAFATLAAAGVATVLLTRHDDTAVPATSLGDRRFF